MHMRMRKNVVEQDVVGLGGGGHGERQQMWREVKSKVGVSLGQVLLQRERHNVS